MAPTPFWRDEYYTPVRERLVKAVPAPEVRFKGEFLTVDLHPSQ